LDRLLETAWETIDRASGEQDLAALEQRRTRLLADHDLAQLQGNHRRAEALLEDARTAHQQARDAHRDLEQQIASAQEDLGRAARELEPAPLPPEHRDARETLVTGTLRLTRATLHETIRSVDNALNAELNAAERTLRSSESKLSEERSPSLGLWKDW